MKPRVLLLHPEYHHKEIGYFPLGLGYIASATKFVTGRLRVLLSSLG